MEPTQTAAPQQPAPQQPVTQPSQPVSSKKGLAIAALILGIVAFCFGWTPIFGLIVGAIAVVLGIMALKKRQHKVMSVLGIVFGGVALLSSLLFTLFWAAAFHAAQTYQNNTSNTGQSNQSTMNTSAWDADSANAAYDKITTGMTKDEVKAITGRDPESCYQNDDSTLGITEYCTYGNAFTDKVTFDVVYSQSKVTSKSKYTH